MCGALRGGRPLLAARATLYVGLLFVTVLPFDVLVDGEWEAMLVSGLLWLTAGLRALRYGLGLAHCRACGRRWWATSATTPPPWRRPR